VTPKITSLVGILYHPTLSIFIPDPNKETSDYATLRKTAIEEALGNGSPDREELAKS
jgi:hypothetical protein